MDLDDQQEYNYLFSRDNPPSGIPVVDAKFHNNKITDVPVLYLTLVVLGGLLCQLVDNSLRFFISCVICSNLAA